MKVRARWAAVAVLGVVGALLLARSLRAGSETPVELAEVVESENPRGASLPAGKFASGKRTQEIEQAASQVRAAVRENAEEEAVARPSGAVGAAVILGADPQNAPGVPLPKHMLATPEEARLLPPVPTAYGPLKVSPELARQYAEEREHRYAVALDTILKREEPDPEAAVELEQKAESGLHQLKKIAEIGVPEVDCGEALCRLTFDFDSAEAQRRAFPLLRGIGLVTGTEAWVKPPSKSDGFELLVYVGRGGKLPITEDG